VSVRQVGLTNGSTLWIQDTVNQDDSHPSTGLLTVTQYATISHVRPDNSRPADTIGHDDTAEYGVASANSEHVNVMCSDMLWCGGGLNFEASRLLQPIRRENLEVKLQYLQLGAWVATLIAHAIFANATDLGKMLAGNRRNTLFRSIRGRIIMNRQRSVDEILGQEADTSWHSLRARIQAKKTTVLSVYDDARNLEGIKMKLRQQPTEGNQETGDTGAEIKISPFNHRQAKYMRKVLAHTVQDLKQWKQAESAQDRWLAEVRQHALFENEDEYCIMTLPPLACVLIQQLLWQ